MWLFSIMAIIIVIGTGLCYLIMGHLEDIYIHLAAYAFLLAGVGYLIKLMEKREKNMEAHMEWILDKKFKVFSEELKTIRTMILKLEDRRDINDLSTPPAPFIPPPPPVPKLNGNEKYSGPIGKQKIQD